jgi:hypothetical protein
VEYICVLIKLDWIAAALYWLFSSGGVGVTFHNPLANKKQETIPEEISQTLLNNKKQGNLDYVHADNIIQPT